MAKQNSIASRLKEMKKDWKGAEPRSGGARLPDGQYEGRITGFTIEEYNNRVTAVWVIQVTEGDFTDKEVRKFDGIETQENMAFFKGSLATLGIEIPDDPEDIGEIGDEAEGIEVRFAVKTNEAGYQNIYFNERLDSDSKPGKSGKSGKSSRDSDDDDDNKKDYSKKQLRSLGAVADDDDDDDQQDAIDELQKLADDNDIETDKIDTWEEVADELITILC